MDNYRGSKIGVIVQCENGYVVIPSYGAAHAFDNDGQKIKTWESMGDHYANFLDAVSTNDQSKLNAPIVEGHISSALCHTGGMSHQLGEKVSLADIESSISGESDIFKDSFGRLKDHLVSNGVDLNSDAALTFGADIKFDVKSEQVLGNEKANQMMSREYRAGFEVPSIGMKAAS